MAGSRGRGIHIVTRTGDLDAVPTDGPLLAQRYHKPDGRDHKLFRIGDEIFGVRRTWPLNTYADKIGEPFAPDAELREMTRRVGQVFGIDLYRVDIVVSQGRPLVVDVDKFGSFVGVPEAPARLADYLYTAALRAGER